jgi:methanogenic corrinoid protein MtbC1
MQRSNSGSARRARSPHPDAEPPIRPFGPVGDPPPDWLRRLVESELVPRLTDRPGLSVVRAVPPAMPVDADVEALVELLLDDDVDACYAWVDALRATGIDAPHLRDALIAHAARRLGELWDDDLCDFAQVSIGLGRLQSLVHHLGGDPPLAAVAASGRLLLAKLPGTDHLLGPVIVADAFRRAGWDVHFDPCASEADLLETARTVRFDVIGLTVALDRDFGPVRDLLSTLRAASLNPSVSTMAGGPALARWPALSADLGADFVPADAPEAVSLATRTLPGQAGRRVAEVPQATGRDAAARRVAPAPVPVPALAAQAEASSSGAAAPLPERRTRFRRTAALRLAGTLASLTAHAA